MTGEFCWRSMAMATASNFSTSTFEPVFWMTVALATMELARLADRGIRSGRTVALWWVLLGVAAGLWPRKQVERRFSSSPVCWRRC